ncbi:MAG: hypothetical protein WC699_10090 [Bacteroidales bacterium]|jgi:hypothetical protein
MKRAIIGGLFIVILAVTMTGIIPSCTHETLNLARFDTLCFERDIQHIFTNACTTKNCHSGQGEEMDLTNYEGIKRGITAGSPAQSRIYQAITSSMMEPMPPTHALAESDRILIRIWIEQGAKDIKCLSEPNLNLTNEGGVK